MQREIETERRVELYSYRTTYGRILVCLYSNGIVAATDFESHDPDAATGFIRLEMNVKSSNFIVFGLRQRFSGFPYLSERGGRGLWWDIR
jgi:hypothetical protein